MLDDLRRQVSTISHLLREPQRKLLHHNCRRGTSKLHQRQQDSIVFYISVLLDLFCFFIAMSTETNETKCVWLIDMGYLTKASKGRGKVDYLAVKTFLESKYNGGCFPVIFNSVDASGVDTGLNQFYFTMKKAGFEVNLYRMEGGAQKQVDVAIGAHLVYHALKDRAIILSSGDIDFLPAIHLIRNEKPHLPVTLLTYDTGVHRLLVEASTERLLIEDYPELIRR
jgi:uncharacterized LabA/DUF88 family protein